MEKKRQKLMGWDKGILTEQQTKGTVTTTILIRRIYKTAKSTEQLSPPSAPHAPKLPLTSPPGQLPQPEPSMAAHGMEYPVLFSQFGSARPALSPPGFW